MGQHIGATVTTAAPIRMEAATIIHIEDEAHSAALAVQTLSRWRSSLLCCPAHPEVAPPLQLWRPTRGAQAMQMPQDTSTGEILSGSQDRR
jgi:hypothetical protein